MAIAHRGGAGLAAENTMAAFSRSYDLGLRVLETDVRATRDGVAVAFHDVSLRRVAGLRHAVHSLTWEQLRDVDVLGGHRIPRLDDLLDAFPDAEFAIDLKHSRAIEPTARALRAAPERVCIAGAWDRQLLELQRVVPVTVALGWHGLTRLIARGVPARRVGPGQRFAHIPLRLLTQRLLDRAHDLGLKVVVWTVDDPIRMRSLLAAGVDGIITDRPDILRDVLIERGQWRPPTRSLATP